MKILSNLSLIEYSENNPNIIWKGPDFFNLLGFCKEDIDLIKDNPNRLLSSFSHYLTNFADEIFNRELSYYKNILQKHIKSEEFNLIFKSICTKQRNEDNQKFGYAMLKSETVTFYIKEFRVIIGRSTKKAK